MLKEPKQTNIEKFNSLDKNYVKLLETAKHKILSARISVAKAVCREQISLYWWFGQQIVKAQEKHGWGKSVVEQLSIDLKKLFSGTTSGFSPQNLWYMRQFYLEYKDYPNLQQLVGEIGWGPNILIMSKIKDIKARQYYLQTTRDMGWTRNTLELQIQSEVYERHILERKQNNFEKALPAHSIGIILCTSKNHVDVEYTLRSIDKPIGVSEFRLTRKLPKEFNDKLPKPAELEKEILRELEAPDER